MAHYFAPSGLSPIPKDIFFIIDSSGSMEGAKLSQVKVAIAAILDHLQPSDMFNIITFSTWLQFWSAEGLLPGSQSNVAKAKDFLQHVTADGGLSV